MSALALDARDRALLAGEGGAGAQFAMRIVVRMAGVLGAARLLDIASAHIDSALYIGPATLAFAERLAELGARVAVPATLNVGGVDEQHWRAWAVPPAHAAAARRQMDAYRALGCTPTWTCAPYHEGHRPAFGAQVAAGESNVIVFFNSVLGARTERYPDLLDICCAITGRAPAFGLHLTAARAGRVLVRLDGVEPAVQAADDFWPVLGFWLGRAVDAAVPVLDGLAVRPDEEALKALGAAAAASGAVGLFHVVGVTPEAPTRAAALQGRAPARVLAPDTAELAAARAELGGEEGAPLDLVVLGSPHLSFAAFARLAALLDGRRRAAGTRLLVTTSRVVRDLAAAAGHLAALEAFGGEVSVDTCILTSPMLPPEVKTLMSDSAKYAYYAPGLLGTRVAFGGLEDCVASAVAGRVVRGADAWRR